jgi:uncharacterized protein (DUF2141 family)
LSWELFSVANRFLFVKQLITSLFLFIFFVCGSQTTTVELDVKGISELNGNLMIAVYSNSSNFPNFGQGEINLTEQVDAFSMRISVPHLKLGESYAIAVFHDVNLSKSLDKNLMGMPVEKYGFSNDVRGMLGPPNFNEAKFEIVKDQRISITID